MITKRKQKINIENPINLVIFHLKIRMDKKTRTNIMNKSTIEQTMPSAETGTGLLNTMVNRNQGSGKLQRTKKRERNVIYKGNFQLFLNFPCCSYLDVTFFSKQLVFFFTPFYYRRVQRIFKLAIRLLDRRSF